MAQVKQSGIEITIKAWLPTGKTISENHAALTKVTDAHASGDYASLLTELQDIQIQTVMKRKHVEVQAPFVSNGIAPQASSTEGHSSSGASTGQSEKDDRQMDIEDVTGKPDDSGLTEKFDAVQTTETENADDFEPPAFLSGKQKKSA